MTVICLGNEPSRKRWCHESGVRVFLKSVMPDPVSRGHCVMCISDFDILDKAGHLYAGFAHIAILEVPTDSESLSQ